MSGEGDQVAVSNRQLDEGRSIRRCTTVIHGVLALLLAGGKYGQTQSDGDLRS
jgi:hypothetical protein